MPTHIFIDEAGHADEAETLLPLTMARAPAQIILAGSSTCVCVYACACSFLGGTDRMLHLVANPSRFTCTRKACTPARSEYPPSPVDACWASLARTRELTALVRALWCRGSVPARPHRAPPARSEARAGRVPAGAAHGPGAVRATSSRRWRVGNLYVKLDTPEPPRCPCQV